MAPKTELKIGDVVQIDGTWLESMFAGCFMLVTDPKPWGAQGFVSIPGARGTLPGQAYFRCPWDRMELIGRAEWMPANEVATDA